MPKYPTQTTLIDKLPYLSTSSLNKLGYFEPLSIKFGRLHWHLGGQRIVSIEVKSNLLEEDNFYLTLHYSYGEMEIVECISITTVESNLGRGKIYMLICPCTGVRCRKLHLHKGNFVHRSSIKHSMYSKQTITKEIVKYDKLFGSKHKVDEAFELLHSKHFKKIYKGNSTKRYSKAMRIINANDAIDQREYEMALAFGLN